MKYLVATVLIAGLLSSCATQRFEVNAPVSPSGAATLDTPQTFFIGGIGQTAVTDAAAVCGGAANVASVETQLSFIDGLLSTLTGGIYTPRTGRVYCLRSLTPN